MTLATILHLVGGVELAAVRARIERADPEVLAEEEGYELLLEEAGAPAEVIEAELAALARHYQRAARGGYAIVSYTT